MISLSNISFTDLLPFVEDFKRKAVSFEPPTDFANAVGIFNKHILIGYFIISNAGKNVLQIEQGYLRPEYRHKRFHLLSMSLLQQNAKQAGYKQIILKACRSLKAYAKFMTNAGYKPLEVVFSKEI